MLHLKVSINSGKLPGICSKCGLGIPSIPPWMRSGSLIKQKRPKSICKDCYTASWLRIK